MTDPAAHAAHTAHASRGVEPVRLTLASASPARRDVLRRAGIEPVIVVSHVDEQALLPRSGGGLTPADSALLLARAKCETVAADPACVGTVVLGCDSVLELSGVAYGKPDTPAVATERWRQMSGSSGVLHTGHWVVDCRAATNSARDLPAEPDAVHPGLGLVVSTTIRFAELTEAEIDWYVATGEPLGCAGGFTIDGIGGPFIRGLDGDHLNVIGLSLHGLRGLLAAREIPWQALCIRKEGLTR